MARLLISTQLTPFPSLPVTPARAFFRSSTSSPAVTFSGDHFLRRSRGLRLVTRAGANANSYIFAFSIPFSLLLGTVLTALKIGADLDRKYLEEVAINEAIMEADKENEEDESPEISLEQKPAVPRTRNRPKKEVEV